MPGPFRLAKRCLVGLLLLAAGVGLVAVFLPRSVSGRESDGQISGATVKGDTATLTGTVSITGLGGSSVPFTFVVQKGGPGATAVLTVNTLPTFPFNELLVAGSFRVQGRTRAAKIDRWMN